ncbi:MAG: zinc dependent phospholipase C family protein, partial [Gemmatimonadota bacterium]
GRHCHYWSVGEEILETAANARLRSVGLGYLCHLAADTVAHNYFIPRQLVLTSSTRALGHSYWEHRLDARLGTEMSARARETVMDYDHSEADAHLDDVLSGTIFSFETNRRIFRGMIRIQDNDRWRAVFERVVHQSRWDLADEEAEAYLSRAFNYMVEYLLREDEAFPTRLDPTGQENLRIAKRVRREALRDGAWRDRTRLHEIADQYFPLPRRRLGYWERTRDRDPLARDGSEADEGS